MPNSPDGEPNVRTPAAEGDGRFGLQIEDLCLPHPGGKGLDQARLAIQPGETIALLGPSGAGKSTLVELVAGLTRARSGTIHIAGHDVTSAPPRRRDVGVILQDVPLYEHLNVRANVELATSGRRLDRAENAAEVDAALNAVEAADLAERTTTGLSGGERARVAVARILARRPAVALLDEPYAAVDLLHRGPLRRLVRTRLKDTGAAVLHVTHDIEEAIDVADRVAIMASGRILQVGTVEELRDQPIDPLISAFFPPTSS